MMMLTTKLTAHGWPAAEEGDLRKVMGASLVNIAKAWQQDTMPRHFESGASRRYRYARRTEAYVRRKKRKYGHERALVKTGDAERAAGAARVTVTKGAARVTLPALPWYFVRVMPAARGGEVIDKMKELGRLTQDEGVAMATAMRDEVTMRLNLMQKTKEL